jgi:hypothetical protein
MTIHSVFTPFTSERLCHPKLIPAVQRLFEACHPPHHIVLKWFVHKNLDRLSESQRRWAIPHFVTRAADPRTTP